MFDRLDVSLYQVKPKVIVMCIGGNNIYTMFKNYVDIIIGIRNNLPSTQVIIHSIYYILMMVHTLTLLDTK